MEDGFTLIEIVVTIVVIGVLTAVAIMGINGLDSKSSSSACEITMDAAKNATAAYYTQARVYPQQFSDLTNPPSKPLLRTNSVVIETATTLEGRGWTLQLIPGATAADETKFSC